MADLSVQRLRLQCVHLPYHLHPLLSTLFIFLAFLNTAASEPPISPRPERHGPALHLIDCPPVDLHVSEIIPEFPSARFASSASLHVGAETFAADSSTSLGATPPPNTLASKNLLQIGYEGGKVMVDPIKVYVIFYGPRWRKRTRAIIRDFLSSITVGSRQPSVRRWWGTLREYTDDSGRGVNPRVQPKGFIRDKLASMGTKLSQTNVTSLVTQAIEDRKFPLDTNGVYLLLTDKSIEVEGFCDVYCGYHDYVRLTSGKFITFAFVGNPARCTGGVGLCSRGVNTKSSPNGFLGVDAMVWSLGHEMAEMTTDPHLDAWLFPVAGTLEVADICQVHAPPRNFSCGPDCVYNVYGTHRRRFWVPSIWSRLRESCEIQAQLNA